MVKVPRGRGPHDGSYFIVDTKLDRPVAVNLSAEKLQEMARKLGVLASYEEVRR